MDVVIWKFQYSGKRKVVTTGSMCFLALTCVFMKNHIYCLGTTKCFDQRKVVPTRFMDFLVLTYVFVKIFQNYCFGTTKCFFHQMKYFVKSLQTWTKWKPSCNSGTPTVHQYSQIVKLSYWFYRKFSVLTVRGEFQWDDVTLSPS